MLAGIGKAFPIVMLFRAETNDRVNDDGCKPPSRVPVFGKVILGAGILVAIVLLIGEISGNFGG